LLRQFGVNLKSFDPFSSQCSLRIFKTRIICSLNVVLKLECHYLPTLDCMRGCFILQEIVSFRELIYGFLVDEYGTVMLCDFLLIMDVVSWFVFSN
jgi:hypothetical protein